MPRERAPTMCVWRLHLQGDLSGFDSVAFEQALGHQLGGGIARGVMVLESDLDAAGRCSEPSLHVLSTLCRWYSVRRRGWSDGASTAWRLGGIERGDLSQRSACFLNAVATQVLPYQVVRCECGGEALGLNLHMSLVHSCNCSRTMTAGHLQAARGQRSRPLRRLSWRKLWWRLQLR